MKKKSKINRADEDMAKFILKILYYDPPIVWSWGFHEAEVIKNGVRFKVQGFLHQGFVEVVYNEGLDLFDISFFREDRTIISEKSLNGIYGEDLVNILDLSIEKNISDEEYDALLISTYGEKLVAALRFIDDIGEFNSN